MGPPIIWASQCFPLSFRVFDFGRLLNLSWYHRTRLPSRKRSTKMPCWSISWRILMPGRMPGWMKFLVTFAATKSWAHISFQRCWILWINAWVFRCHISRMGYEKSSSNNSRGLHLSTKLIRTWNKVIQKWYKSDTNVIQTHFVFAFAWWNLFFSIICQNLKPVQMWYSGEILVKKWRIFPYIW